RAIFVQARAADRWEQGAYEVWLLRGGVRLEQGDITATAEDAVLWIDRAPAYSGRPSKIIAYLEHRVAVDYGRPGEPHRETGRAAQSVRDETWFGRFHTNANITIDVPQVRQEANVAAAVFQRGMDARRPSAEVSPAQFVAPPSSVPPGAAPPVTPETLLTPPAQAAAATGQRRVRVYPRSTA